MKKILLTVACLFIANPASAVILDNIWMDFYDAANPRNYTGYSSSVTGAIDTQAGTGSLVCNGFECWDNPWSADVQWVSETTGANTWSGYALPTTVKTTTYYSLFSYNFDLAQGDIAVGLFFDWSTNIDIPLLAVFHPEAYGRYSAVDQLWTDYYGNPGTGMQTSPFPGQWPAFSTNLTLAPEPATLALIGAGLLGLAGVKRRKK